MISQYLGFDSDYIIIGLAALVLILIILMIINVVQMSKLKKSYKIFMKGKNAKNLEDTLIKRLNQVDDLINANSANEKNIKTLFQNMQRTYQKMGLVKYDAFNEMGGKLSFSLAMLDAYNASAQTGETTPVSPIIVLICAAGIAVCGAKVKFNN